MLESITTRPSPLCNDLSILPYIDVGPQSDSLLVSRAPCFRSVCLFETSIDLLSNVVKPFASTTEHMLDLEATNAALMGDDRRSHYLSYPPSHAVDGRPDTAFCSFQGTN